MAAKLKTSPWVDYDHQGHPNPDRPGPYQTAIYPTEEEKRIFWRWWDGKKFGPCCDTKREAVKRKVDGSRYAGRPGYWRGVLK